MKQRKYSIVLEPEEGGGYAVIVPALPGCRGLVAREGCRGYALCP